MLDCVLHKMSTSIVKYCALHEIVQSSRQSREGDAPECKGAEHTLAQLAQGFEHECEVAWPRPSYADGLPGSLLSVDMLDVIHSFISCFEGKGKDSTFRQDQLHDSSGKNVQISTIYYLPHLMTKMKKFFLCICVKYL